MVISGNRNNKRLGSYNYITYLKQKGMSNTQIIRELEKQGYTSSQIFNALNQQSFPKQPYPSTKQQDMQYKKSNKKFLFFIAFIAILSFIIILTRILTQSEDKLLFEEEDLVFVSEADLEFQSKVKETTGYDWTNFLNARGNKKAKTAALLFLAEEIGSLDSNFDFVDRSVGLNKNEMPGRLNPVDSSRENLLNFIGNVKAVDNIFLENGLNSVQIRINRLTVIENYFNKHSLPEGEINENVAALFAEILGLTMDDYPRLISLMIVNYNLFLAD